MSATTPERWEERMPSLAFRSASVVLQFECPIAQSAQTQSAGREGERGEKAFEHTSLARLSHARCRSLDSNLLRGVACPLLMRTLGKLYELY